MHPTPLLRTIVFIGLALFVPATTRAHEVLHEIERGKAIAVKAYFADGDVLAYTEYQVFSPTDTKIPYQKGRTDRSGYVAFVPDSPGHWHVKITDSTGHGLALDVPVEPPNPSDAKQASPHTSTGLASWAFVVRPLLGVALIAALFAGLVLFFRKKACKK